MEELVTIKQEVSTPPPALSPTIPLASLSSSTSDNIENEEKISVSEYLKNNFPPSSQCTSREIQYFSNIRSATMVPLASNGEDLSNFSDVGMAESLEYQQGIMDVEEMKKIKRRMKNKISAQESRRRKKEYVDTLEFRLKQRDEENALLRERLVQKEEENRSLVNDLFAIKQKQSREDWRKRPYAVSQISRATQTGTCLYCYRCHQEDKLEVSTARDSKFHESASSIPYKTAYSKNGYSNGKAFDIRDRYEYGSTVFRGSSSGFYLPEDGDKKEHIYKYRGRYSPLYNHSSYHHNGRSSLPTSKIHSNQTSPFAYQNKTDNFIHDGRRSNEPKHYTEQLQEKEIPAKPTPIKFDPVSSSYARGTFHKTNLPLATTLQSKTMIFSPQTFSPSNTTPSHQSSIMETSSLFSQLMNTDHLSSPSHT